MTKTWVVIDFDIAGMHHFPGHLTLHIPHIHVFLFMVKIEEKEGERSIEFLELRDNVKRAMLASFPRIKMPKPKEDVVLDFGPRSCEDLAKVVASKLSMYVPTSIYVIMAVSESDEQCGVVYEGTLKEMVEEYKNLPEDRK